MRIHEANRFDDLAFDGHRAISKEVCVPMVCARWATNQDHDTNDRQHRTSHDGLLWFLLTRRM
jgi:hypothetical protein